MFNILECFDACNNFRFILRIVKTIIGILQWSVPLILIGYGTFDLVRAVTSNDEKDGPKHVKTFIKRIIYGIIIFLVPFIVRLFMWVLNESFGSEVGDTKSWYTCWENLDNDKYEGFNDCKSIFDREEYGTCTLSNNKTASDVTESECNRMGGKNWKKNS